MAAIDAESAETARAAWDLPNLDHERVDYWTERFTTDNIAELRAAATEHAHG